MSTTHYEINISLDGEKWTPEQLESLGRGLREAERGEVFPIDALWDGIEGVSNEDREWMAADLSARPQSRDETNRVLGKPTGQVETLTHYIDRSVAKELVALRRRVRKLERALRKAAGREKRLRQELEGKFRYEPRFMWGVNRAQCKCVVENVNV
jgi:hypothetical protein